MNGSNELGSVPRDERVNILLVDDQPAKLLSYEAILSGLGENLIKAHSATEALAKLLQHEVAVLVVDVCMPEIDGFELAATVRQHPRFRETAIILVSAVMITDLDRLKGYDCGAVDYMPVPIVPEILQAKVSMFVELYRKRRQLQRMNQELEARVAERTADLEAIAAELRLSQEQLREANQRKDEFLAVLGHELRNPLGALRNGEQVLALKAGGNPELLWCCEVIGRQVQHLTRLVDDLLDVSRITRGKINLRWEHVDLADVVERAIEITRPLIEARGHSLSVHLPDPAPVIEGDPVRLAQVVGNLLDNAAKYTANGGEIALRVERVDEPAGEGLRIRVRDTGRGIPPALLPRVFELFTQAPQTREESQGGLGVGLALARHVVEIHGGRIEAHSAGAGHGSEFIVHLPAGGPRTQAAARADADTSEKPPSPCRILVVDDFPDAAEAQAALLRAGGNEVWTAYDGVEAVDATERLRPDVVLLDIGLPRLDGLAAARRIRERPWGKQVVLIAQTGWGQAEDRRSTAAAGFDGHLTKPVLHSDLVRLLSELRG
jgi:signal transduction histidine kinase